ncbi:hypothetical protein M9435_003492 [Picochlorum sp. BPE23]|nr:hypothetical protein M9435_003492 [Picochlorum sp. BPE23]
MHINAQPGGSWWLQAALVLLVLGTKNNAVRAFWTVDCGVVTIEKSDPIVSFGQTSAHMHVVAGSSGFGPDATNAILRENEYCTSCNVKQDKSAYWTPQLYVAPEEASGLLEDEIKATGGVAVPPVNGNAFVVYYKLITDRGEKFNNDDSWEEIAAFPADFKMLASEGLIKEKTKTARNVFDRPVTYKCLGFGDQMDTAGFPSDPSKCTVGLRTQLTFPSCWDGKNSDSADHVAHVSYPTGSWAGSPCPASHPVRIPTLFYEVIYNTASLKEYFDKGWKLVYPGMPNQFTQDGGDPLFHGDFMNGWEQSFLKDALAQCGVTPCGLIKKQFSGCVKESAPVPVSPSPPPPVLPSPPPPVLPSPPPPSPVPSPSVPEEGPTDNYQGVSSDGTVTVFMSDTKQLVSINITEDAYSQGKNKLSELIQEAINDAYDKASAGINEKMIELGRLVGVSQPIPTSGICIST